MSIAVHISTYGGDEWKQLALDRAFRSARLEEPDEIIVHHDPHGTISQVRNAATTQSSADWLCFLDADDELQAGYIEAMRRSTKLLNRRPGGERILHTPMVSYIRNGRPERPRFWPEVELHVANWLVIGTLVHRSLFRQVGGFKDYGDPPGSNAFEDFALWSRCYKAGARVHKVRQAVYVAHVDKASRHRGADRKTREAWHLEIGRDIWPDHYANGLPTPRRRSR